MTDCPGYRDDATYEHGHVCIGGVKVTDPMLYTYCDSCRERIIRDMTVLLAGRPPKSFTPFIGDWSDYDY